MGKNAKDLLAHKSTGIPKGSISLPGPDFVERIMSITDRTPATLRNMQLMYNTGRLAGTGYLSILPVDQGIEHSAAAWA